MLQLLIFSDAIEKVVMHNRYPAKLMFFDTPHRIGGWGFLSNPETDSQRRYQCTPTDSTQV